MLLTAEAIRDYHDLFDSANHEIAVFTGKEDLAYGEEFITAARSFLSHPGRKLRIACQCGAYMVNCQILKRILTAPDRQSEVLLYDARAFAGKEYFTLIDESAYRIEIPETCETIQDYGDSQEIARLQEELHCILSLSSVEKHPPMAK